MSARELVFEPSNGAVTTLTFTESSLTVRSASTTADTPKQHSFIFSSSTKPSHYEIPIRNVIAATVSGSTVEVSYLAHTGKQCHMKQVRGEVTEKNVPLAKEWSSSITQVAYQGGNPSKALKVLINPHGGPGKAPYIFAQKVEPILRAAGCTLDVTLTTRAGHATEIAQNVELTFDALVVVSGDGLVHEVVNGLAKHATPEKAFSIPIAPIPAGSGNGLSLNILGIHDGLDPCTRGACLSVSPGRPMKVDLFSFTQGNQKRISFMSQTVGLMADVDIETEHLRWMGDLRFIWGFLRGVVTRKTCKMELSMKVVEQDKSQMVDALYARRKSAAKGVPPALPASDITPSDDKQADGTVRSDDWVRFDKPILYMFAGKGPYVSRSLMQFPVSHPDDGLIDISIQEIVGRKFLLDAMEGAEVGRSYWFTSNRYFKASAYRAKPLTASGVLMVDGEAFPFEEFQIEVLHRLGTLLSPNPYYAADFNVIDAKGTRRETT
ncbi:ATP-NAD kinase-like domain-containing protein [Butyriboletus roseoflavus]|nr:ATP-NAD kinase-like domain-containing protein [Butyriboletus roseoflavus]